MKKNGFVYVWENVTNNKKYIGYHVGDVDDGYISSSRSTIFWNDFNNPSMTWKRTIVFTGDSTLCLMEEQKLLKNVNFGDEYYNNARGAEVIFTDEVRMKMSIAGKKRYANMSESEKLIRNKKISESKKGKPRSIETINKLKEHYNNDQYIGIIPKENYEEIKEKIRIKNTGKKRSEKFKLEHRNRFLGEKGPMYGKHQSEEFKQNRRDYLLKNNPGKNKTELTKKRISEAKKGTPSPFKGISRDLVTCPYCGNMGGMGVMQRWHFDNCKNK